MRYRWLFVLMLGFFCSYLMATENVSYDQVRVEINRLKSEHPRRPVPTTEIQASLERLGINQPGAPTLAELNELLNSPLPLHTIQFLCWRAIVEEYDVIQAAGTTPHTFTHSAHSRAAMQSAARPTAARSDFRVNDDQDKYEQNRPAVAVAQNGQWVAAWADSREGSYDIFAQRFDAAGNPLGANFRVSRDSANSHQSLPAVAMSSQGQFVICWEDHRAGNPDIMGQIFTAAGEPLGANFRINDDPGTSDQLGPKIAMDTDGNWVVVWYDYRAGNYDIYGQRFSADGQRSGTNFPINAMVGKSNQIYPAVAQAPNGNFVAAWEDYRNGNADIYAQRFLKDGARQGQNFIISTDSDANSQVAPAIAVDSLENFTVVWRDTRDGNRDIYGQWFLANGAPSGVNQKINTDAGTSNQWQPAVSRHPDGSAIVVWDDERNQNWDIYGQLFDVSGLPVKQNYRVHQEAGTSTQRYPAVKFSHRTIIYAWEDNRNSSENRDIFARLDEMELPPNPWRLTAPRLHQALNTNPPVLKFQAPPNVKPDSIHFKIEVASDSNFTNQLTGSPFESVLNLTGFDPKPPLSWPDTLGSFKFPTRLTDGAYYWRLAAQNASGYGKFSAPGDFLLDTTPPQTAQHQPGKGATEVALQTSLQVEVSDALSGIARSSIKMKIDQNYVQPTITGNSQEFVLVFDPATDFQYNQTVSVTIEAKDLAGNTMRKDTYTFSTVTDTTPPFAADFNPAPNAVNVPRRTGITFHLRDTKSGIQSSSIELQVNGNAVQPVITGVDSHYVVTYQPPQDFEFRQVVTLQITARDRAGNQFGPQNYVFTIEKQPNQAPGAPTLVSPLNHACLNDSSLRLTWRGATDANDDSLHYRIELAADADFIKSVAGSPFESRLQPKGFEPQPPVAAGTDTGRFTLPAPREDGNYWWRVSAWDGQVYGAASTAFQLVIDRQPPQLRAHYPETDAFNIPIDTRIVIELTDSLSGIDTTTIRLWVQGHLVTPQITPQDSGYRVSYAPSQPWPYLTRISLMVRAADYAGNEMEPFSFSFSTLKPPNVAPETPVLVFPAHDQSVNLTPFKFVWLVPTDVNGDSLDFKVEIARDNSFTQVIPGSPFESQFAAAGFMPVPPLAAGTDSGGFQVPASLASGTYWWRVTAWDGQEYGPTSPAWRFTIPTAGVDYLAADLPNTYALAPNYPNPFNPVTRFQYSLPKPGLIKLEIFDVHGRLVISLEHGFRPAGRYQAQWDARDRQGNPVASGIYIGRLTTHEIVLQQKLVFMK